MYMHVDGHTVRLTDALVLQRVVGRPVAVLGALAAVRSQHRVAAATRERTARPERRASRGARAGLDGTVQQRRQRLAAHL